MKQGLGSISRCGSQKVSPAKIVACNYERVYLYQTISNCSPSHDQRAFCTKQFLIALPAMTKEPHRLR
jgi:hypothetical protein